MSTIRRPSSIDGIKRLAKQLSREQHIKHHAALDEAAKLAGYHNFIHARRELARRTAVPHDPRDEFRQRSLAMWAVALEAINPSGARTSSWADLGGIVQTLAHFVGPAANHAHLPNGGGLDYETLAFSREPGMLEFGIQKSWAHVLKPRRLTMEYIDHAPGQSPLFLELAEIPRLGSSDPNLDSEDLSEKTKLRLRVSEVLLDIDGEYYDREIWDRGYLDHDERGLEIPLPESSKLITRWTRGKILLVAKGSLWNSDPDTYDGRHNFMAPADVRELIERSLSIAA